MITIIQRAARNAMASATSHATITSEATAPAVILAFSLKVVGRSMSDDIGSTRVEPSKRATVCSIKNRGGVRGRAHGRIGRIATSRWRAAAPGNKAARRTFCRV